MKFFLVFMLTLSCAIAQTPPRRPAQPRKSAPAKPITDPSLWPIKSIQVEGAKTFSQEQIIAASGLKPGDLATKENFEAARDRVLASGCCESFGWKYEPLQEGGAFTATLVITEVDLMLPWMLDRLPVDAHDFDTRARKELPLFADKMPATDAYIRRVAALLEKMAAAKGFTGPVIGRVTLIGKDTMTILFGPKAPPPNIAEVRFLGARIIEPRYLTKAMHEVAAGTPYIEPNFRVVLESQIRPLYESAGRLRAAFTKITTEPAPNVRGIIVTVTVDEGASYTLEGIDVTGTPLSSTEIDELAEFRKLMGKTVNYSDIGRGLEKVMDKLKAGGYLRVAYKGTRKLDDENKTVSMSIEMNPGPQYRFGTLNIVGLDIESEPVIRKMWALKFGSPYRHGYPELFLQQIRERQLFDDLGETKADIKIDDKNLTVDVTLTFKGTPPDPTRQRRRK